MLVETVLLRRCAGLRCGLRPLPGRARAHQAATSGHWRGASHADFLSRHLAEMVLDRYLPKEWPRDLAELVPALDPRSRSAGGHSRALATEAIAWLARRPQTIPAVTAESISFFDLVVDWYRLRNGAMSHCDVAAATSRAFTDRLPQHFAGGSWPGQRAGTHSGAPADDGGLCWTGCRRRDFAIDLADGDVEPSVIAAAPNGARPARPGIELGFP